jgi:hypothetical protein
MSVWIMIHFERNTRRATFDYDILTIVVRISMATIRLEWSSSTTSTYSSMTRQTIREAKKQHPQYYWWYSLNKNSKSNNDCRQLLIIWISSEWSIRFHTLIFIDDKQTDQIECWRQLLWIFILKVSCRIMIQPTNR